MYKIFWNKVFCENFKALFRHCPSAGGFRILICVTLHPFPSRSNRYMNEVLPGLYLGGIYALEEGSQIISNKIDAIVTVGEFFCEFHKPHLKNLARIKLNLRDNKDCDILQHVSTVNSFIQKKRLDKSKSRYVLLFLSENVFVHCFGGVSRSVAFVIAYLMTITDLTLETCLSYVKTKRRAAQPNEGFLKQLEKYQLEVVLIPEMVGTP